MSVERQGGVLIYCCDKCTETYDAETGIFAEAWQDAKRQGWRAFKEGDVWCHSCPDCSAKFARYPT